VVHELVEIRDRVAADPGAMVLPVTFRVNVTAWQESPRSLVVSGDPAPGEPDRYPMTHPVFAFEWTDGRQLVVDAGLARSEAAAFGAPADWLGGEAMHCNPSAWDALGRHGRRVAAVLFTHLHEDHVTGVLELCREGPVEVRLSPEQQASSERFERVGREWLEDPERKSCVRRAPWRSDGEPAAVEALTDFSGVFRVAVPGHTPGSQLLVGFVAGRSGEVRSVVIAGDVVNHRAGFQRDLPKPWWYRWFIVREDEDAQRGQRARLRALDAAGFEILVNHHLPGAVDKLVPRACPD
jgi:glyoxylase-like metal-dependent hydrolase (beta-lactamase superfamily II)